MALKCLINLNRNFWINRCPHKNQIFKNARNSWWSSSPGREVTNYNVVSPGNVTEQISPYKIPDHIVLPPYAKSGIPLPRMDEEVNILLGRFLAYKF